MKISVKMILIITNKLKSVKITLKTELTETNRIGPDTVVIALLGKINHLATPLDNVTPDFIHHILDVQSASVNWLTEGK